MGYNENIPLEGDDPTRSQGDLLNNFQAINEGFNVNHGGFNDPEKKGKHNLVSLVKQEEAPSTTATEGALYTKEDDDEKINLFYREKDDGDELQITNPFKSEETGNITMPGGLKFSWGEVTVIKNGENLVTPEGITTILNIQLSANGNVDSNFAWDLVSPESFRVLRSGTPLPTNVTWFVVGK